MEVFKKIIVVDLNKPQGWFTSMMYSEHRWSVKCLTGQGGKYNFVNGDLAIEQLGLNYKMLRAYYELN